MLVKEAAIMNCTLSSMKESLMARILKAWFELEAAFSPEDQG